MSRRSMFAVLVCVLSAPVASPQTPHLEDRTKFVAVVPPKGFVFSAESSPELLRFTGSRVSGVTSEMGLFLETDGRPMDDVMTEALAERRSATEEAGPLQPWTLDAASADFTHAQLFDHRVERSSVRTGVALRRWGPWVLGVTVDGHAKALERGHDDLVRCLAELEERLPDPVFHDEALGTTLYLLPPGFDEEDFADDAAAGVVASWATREKGRVQARVRVLALPYPEQALEMSAWVAQRRDQVASGSRPKGFKARDQWVAGRLAVRMDLELGSSSREQARHVWELGLPGKTHIMVVHIEGLAASFGDYVEGFEKVFTAVVVDPPSGG